MKTMVKLGVLLATLLLLNGVVFAGPVEIPCECYKFNYINLDNPADGGSEYDIICLDYANNTGDFAGCDLFLFPGSITQGLFDNCPCVGHFKFHGSDNNVVTGEEYCEDLNRYTFWGHITDITHCR